MASDSPASEVKAALRVAALAARQTAARAAGPDAGARLAEIALTALPFDPADIVAGYAPVRGEMDCLPLMRALRGRGLACALPVAATRDAALIFRAWRPGEGLFPGRYGIPEPGPDAPRTTPTILLIPVLAFDAAGVRLGYGGGYYDRTLAALRAAGPVLAVGLAYAAQETPPLPAEAFDQRLDWIVTEAGARRFDKQRFDGP